MCGGGERRRTGKGTNERLAKEEDEIGELEIQNFPSFFLVGMVMRKKMMGLILLLEQGSGP